jgi:hypothetical protein
MAIKREPPILLILFTILFFECACAYNFFNVVVEADFLSGEKYETRDVEEVYAEKQSNPDAALLSPTLFTSLPGIIFEFLPSFCSSPSLFPLTFSVLRC